MLHCLCSRTTTGYSFTNMTMSGLLTLLPFLLLHEHTSPSSSDTHTQQLSQHTAGIITCLSLLIVHKFSTSTMLLHPHKSHACIQETFWGELNGLGWFVMSSHNIMMEYTHPLVIRTWPAGKSPI